MKAGRLLLWLWAIVLLVLVVGIGLKSYYPAELTAGGGWPAVGRAVGTALETLALFGIFILFVGGAAEE